MSRKSDFIPALKYDWLTKFYDPILQLTMPERKFKAALIDKMRIEHGYRVLDFGCGSMTLSLMAVDMYPEAEYYGVDVDEKILEIASEKMSKAKKPVFIQSYDGTKLPYPDNYFDRVMSSLVFHHLTLANKYLALNEISRVLKPGGEFHIADFGKPAGLLQRLGFFGVQFLDGFETTNDSVTNILPKAMIQSDFLEVEEKAVFKTLVGTVRLLKGSKKGKTIL